MSEMELIEQVGTNGNGSPADVGDLLIKSKIRQETIRAIFPYFVFLLNCGAVLWPLLQPDLMRTITSGIFFCFSIFIIHRAKLLWRG